MLGLDNPIHIAFILLLLLLVFGAKRLPEMGRSLGHGLRGFKEAVTGQDAVTSITAGTATTAGPAEAATADRPAQPVAEPTQVA